MSKKEMFAPSIVLGCICLVAALLLALTFQVTTPQIEANTAERANLARFEVLEAADGFEKLDVALVDGVVEVYKATNDTGYVITTGTKGFGGTITVMTAIGNDGNIIKIKVTDASNETPGLGSKTTLPDHAAKFVGASKITNAKDGDGTYIAPVTGASYSSKGVFNGVNAALEQFAKIGG